MARPSVHSPDAILDATLAVVLDRGAPAATVAAIAAASGAPTGSLYHRFGSREDLLARLWVRAAERSQERFLSALGTHPDPAEAARAAGLSVFDFVRDSPGDARLLVCLRREDLLGVPSDARLRTELERVNAPVEAALRELAVRFAGAASRPLLDLLALATIDLPQGAVRRHLSAGRRPPARLRPALDVAIRAVIDDIERTPA